jgi:autotransporter strand-loop-strand O-heptosyltransferase
MEGREEVLSHVASAVDGDEAESPALGSDELAGGTQLETSESARSAPETDADARVDAGGDGAKRGAFIRPALLPTQQGPLGIRYDFNDGCRIVLPESDPPWHVRIRDLDTGNILFQTTIPRGRVNSSKRHFVRGRIEIHRAGEKIFAHDYDAAGRNVLISFPVGTLGDTIGWFPYAARFQAHHRCRLTVALAKPLIPLFRDTYPEIEIVEAKDVDPERFYASYHLGLFFDDKASIHQPCDFRLVGLHRTAGYILGVDPKEERPRITIPDAETRPIVEPYVCIATQATTQAKYWNNPAGWREIIRFLKEAGYRVVCIDRNPFHGHGLVWNHLPHGAEDMTGLSLPAAAR